MQNANPDLFIIKKTVKPREKDIPRFFAKVNKNGPIPPHRPELGQCWVWTGTTTDSGYGNFWLFGKFVLAHRASWAIAFSEPLLCVLHHCDNPACCNPAHLFLGTRLHNDRDKVSKGRQAKGATHGSVTKPECVPCGDRNGSRKHPERLVRGDAHWARRTPERVKRGDNHFSRKHPERLARGERARAAVLTEDKVREIRALHIDGNKHYTKTGRVYGITGEGISHIVNRRNWRHVD